MNVTVRKLVVGLVALAVLIGVYLLYARANRTPFIADELVKTVPVSVPEVNVSPSSEVGTAFGTISVDRVEQTQFVHRNERGQVDRVFGFDRLLHREGSQWEITQPYLKVFLPTFRCFVTANRGNVQMESVFSKLTARDARFLGNVIIHILPVEPNDSLECFIHLDDVSFVSAKSLFSSAGAVRFLSRRAQLTGTGMDLIYDEPRSRLELFRIYKLESLRGRSDDLGSAADLTTRQHPKKGAPQPSAGVPPTPGGGPAPASDDLYECVFHGNVAIETPKGGLLARDEFVINDIVWSGSKKREQLTKPPQGPDDPNAAPYPGPNALDTSVSSHTQISAIPPESFDTVVTCDSGFEITPRGRKLKPADRGLKTQTAEQKAAAPPPSAGVPRRPHLTAQRAQVDSFTTDATLEGPVEMTFLVEPNGLGPAPTAAHAMPLTITAQKAVRYVGAANRTILEGDCRATLVRSEPNETYEYLLTAPRFLVDTAADPNHSKSKELAVTVRRFVTDGGPAFVRIRRLQAGGDPNQPLGWTQLDAAQVQYEAEPPSSSGTAPVADARLLALGPGQIWIHNDEKIDPKADPNQFSLARPCYARVTNFHRLTYLMATNRIIAESKEQPLRLDYVPMANGKPVRHALAVAGQVEAWLKEVTKGHLELATLTVTQGIDYEDERNYFVGSRLSYDYAQSLLAVRGDAKQPCLLNGAQVDRIDMDVKTGRLLHGEIAGPGALQIQR